MSAKSGKGTGKDGGDEHDEDAVDTSIIKRLDRDLRVAAKTMSDEEARYLVDAYYTMQDNRKRLENQERQASASKEPCTVITWLAKNNRMLEEAIKVTLDIYTSNHPVGVWAKDVYGIGPVIAAGMLAHIDIRKAETVGHIWRYAGIDPTSSWLGKEKSAKLVKEFLDDRPPTESDVYAIAAQVQRNPTNLLKMATLDKDGAPRNLTTTSLIAALARRPFNAELKVICWKAGQSFMKFSNRPECFYGRHYREQKAKYIAKNENGGFAERSASILQDKKYGRQTAAYAHYMHGHLPPAQIDAMARRWAVKLFLSHLHGFWYEHHFKRAAPAPYPIAHMGHVDLIAAE